MKIFVSVGTHPQQFNRLLQELDKLAGEKKLGADVFAQTGNSDFLPGNFGSGKFLSPKEMEERIRKSDLVISHGGAGTIIGALEQKKPLVIVPRLKKFAEHTNDHQCDLAIAMEKAGKAIAVLEIKQLESAIGKARAFKPKESAGAEGIIREIKSFLLQ